MNVLRTISSQVKYYHKFFFFFFCFTKNSRELYYSYGINSTWHLLCEMYVAHFIRLFFPVSYIDSLPFAFLLLQSFPQSCIRNIWKFLFLTPIGQPECLTNNFFSNYIYHPKFFFFPLCILELVVFLMWIKTTLENPDNVYFITEEHLRPQFAIFAYIIYLYIITLTVLPDNVEFN